MNKQILSVKRALGAVRLATSPRAILDKVANKVIAQAHQGSICEQLWAEKGQPKSPHQQRSAEFLCNETRARREFLYRVAGPISNKLFECGMIA